MSRLLGAIVLSGEQVQYTVQLSGKQHNSGSLSSRPPAVQLPAVSVQPSSHIQMLVEPTAFLFFVSVTMFFPGLPRYILSTRSHQATPGLVTHDRLDPFGQCSDVLLEREHMRGERAISFRACALCRLCMASEEQEQTPQAPGLLWLLSHP